MIKNDEFILILYKARFNKRAYHGSRLYFFILLYTHSKFAEINEEIVNSISIEDFVSVLPAGKSHVVKSGMGEQSSEN